MLQEIKNKNYPEFSAPARAGHDLVMIANSGFFIGDTMYNQSFRERFWSKVDKNADNGCWEWTGCIRNGYGRISINDKMYQAHRVSWEIVNGEIPEGLFICHHCDNRKCIKPSHLFLGTNSDNMQDMIKKGRGNFNHPNIKIGEKNGASKLKNHEVRAIKHLAQSKIASINSLRKLYNISYNTIHCLLNEKTWKHIKL